ncbi:MAG: DNA polymerase III subunit gamma/tau, partial [Thermodesulfobacteriota bacterium]
MSYLVIARKWRPTLFSELVGQEHVTRTLLNAVSSERIAHAYLFSGPRGVGKTTAARILARSINCKSSKNSDPCNECENCLAITNGSSVDCIEIDGASNTGVDNVRELRDSIRFVPAACTYKVYIIDEVHMLSTPAFNALLKTLEEPPEHAVFIFATTEVHKIPRTILSRCQRFDFKRIPFKLIAERLKLIVDTDKIKVEGEVLDIIAREADGSLRDAQSLLDQTIAFSGTDIKNSDVFEALGLMDRTILFELTGFILKKDGRGCLNIVEKVYNFGYDLKKVSLELLELIRDLAVVKVTGDTSLLEMPESEAKLLDELSKGVGIARLQLLFQILTKGYEEISRSETQRFSLEMTLLRGAHLDEIRPIGALIEEVKSLKAGLPPEGLSVKPPHVNKDKDKGPRSGSVPAKAESEEEKPPPTKESKPKEEQGQKKQNKKDAKVDDGSIAGLLASVKERETKLAYFLSDADIKLEGTGLTIVIDKPKGYLDMKMDILGEICRDYFNKAVNITVIEEGEANAG